jgi:hypothetical protein
MNATLYQIIQRLKEETEYLEDNKARFIKEVNTSGDVKKIVERSLNL